MKKPNILFIMSDQMRHDALECNGNDFIKTPNFNLLAQRGMNFKNSYSPDPICVPARASITTGFYSNKCTGRKDNDGIIKEGFPLLGDELNKRGYETYAMGKLHYEPYAPPGKKRTTHGISTVEFAESGRIIEQFDPEYKQRGLEEYYDYLEEVGWGGFSRGDGMGNNDIYPVTSPIPEEHYVDAWVADRAIFHMNKHLEEK
jgi:arylsulfatase